MTFYHSLASNHIRLKENFYIPEDFVAICYNIDKTSLPDVAI